MLRMIKAELYKLFKSTSFKVLCIIAILMMTLTTVMPLIMNEDLIESSGMTMEQYEAMKSQQVDEESVVSPGQMGVNMVGAENEFDIKPYEVFHMAFGAGVMEILMAVLVGAMFAKEYSEGTIKNTLAYGKKRSHFYLAKYAANFIGMTILMAIMTIGSTVGLTIVKGWGKAFEFSQLIPMVRAFAGAMVAFGAVLAVLMVIAALVRNNGAVIGIAVALFVIGPSVVGFLYGQYNWFDKIYEATLYYNSALVTSIKATGTDVLTGSCIGAVWLVVALVVGIGIFNKQEIK